MARIIISRDAQVLQEVELGEGRTTIGRHAYNDIVIEHRAVSGAHAAITTVEGAAVLEDLCSTNGTFVNGERITRHALTDRDRVMVAKFQLDYLAEVRPATAAQPLACGLIEVLNGASAGKTLALTKPITTLGSPAVLVVAISRHADGYFVAHLDGATPGLVNGQAIGKQPRLLCDGDKLELTGTRMRFSLPTA